MHACGEDAVEGLRSTGIIRRRGGFDFRCLFLDCYTVFTVPLDLCCLDS